VYSSYWSSIIEKHRNATRLICLWTKDKTVLHNDCTFRSKLCVYICMRMEKTA
jgi:hypothetical protein